MAARMCTPSMPATQTIPQRQQMQLPDSGSTAQADAMAIAQRRQLMSSAYTGSIGLGAPATTKSLGA